METKAANILPKHRGNDGSTPQEYWPEALAALNRGDYDRLSDLLKAISTSGYVADQIDLIQIALQICLACNHCHSEAEWHHKARQEADERESELRQGLETIITTIINANQRQELSLQREFLHDLLSPSSRSEAPAKPRNHSTIWELIRRFLHFRSPRVSSIVYEKFVPHIENDEYLFTHLKKEGVVGERAQVESVIIDEVSGDQENTPLLVIYCLGTFRVYQNEQPIEDWPSSKCKSLFKYLLAHREPADCERSLMKHILAGCGY